MDVNFEAITELIQKLCDSNQTISTMESCTGGGLANAITSISGASEVFEYGAVTYSNKGKIAMGGKEMSDVIDAYSVYSRETAEMMAKTIALFAGSSYGVGVTGQLGRLDPNNALSQSKLNQVDFSIYDSAGHTFDNVHLDLEDRDRRENKIIIINLIVQRLLQYNL